MIDTEVTLSPLSLPEFRARTLGMRTKSKEYAKLYLREYQRLNRRVLLAKAEEFRKNNRERINQKQAHYVERNRKEIHRRAAKYREKNREAINQRAAVYRDKNREAINEKSLVRSHLRPGRGTEYQGRRRAKLRDNEVGDPLEIETWVAGWKKEDEVTCYWCKRRLPPDLAEADHKQPLSKGGAHSVTNLCISCSHCNRVKHGRPLTKWLTILIESKRAPLHRGFEKLFPNETLPDVWKTVPNIAKAAGESETTVREKLLKSRVPRVKFQGLWHYKP